MTSWHTLIFSLVTSLLVSQKMVNLNRKGFPQSQHGAHIRFLLQAHTTLGHESLCHIINMHDLPTTAVIAAHDKVRTPQNSCLSRQTRTMIINRNHVGGASGFGRVLSILGTAKPVIPTETYVTTLTFHHARLFCPWYLHVLAPCSSFVKLNFRCCRGFSNCTRMWNFPFYQRGFLYQAFRSPSLTFKRNYTFLAPVSLFPVVLIFEGDEVDVCLKTSIYGSISIGYYKYLW